MAFSRPLADNKMLELIKRGRSRATMMSPGGATPEGPEQGISWAGAALRIQCPVCQWRRPQRKATAPRRLLATSGSSASWRCVVTWPSGRRCGSIAAASPRVALGCMSLRTDRSCRSRRSGSMTWASGASGGKEGASIVAIGRFAIGLSADFRGHSMTIGGESSVLCPVHNALSHRAAVCPVSSVRWPQP